MVSWWWLIVAFAVGVGSGVISGFYVIFTTGPFRKDGP